MEVIVFASPGCKLYQNGKLIEEEPIENHDFKYVQHKYIVDDNCEFMLKETFNSFILRLVINLISLLTGSTYKSSEFISLQYRAYQKNNKLANFVFMPLFWYRGKIVIKPVKCDNNTLITIYLLKSKTPYMVETFDGDIDIIHNTRKQIKDKNNKEVK